MSAHLGSLSPELDHLVNMEKNIPSTKLPTFSCALVPKAVRKAWLSMAPSPHVLKWKRQHTSIQDPIHGWSFFRMKMNRIRWVQSSKNQLRYSLRPFHAEAFSHFGDAFCPEIFGLSETTDGSEIWRIT